MAHSNTSTRGSDAGFDCSTTSSFEDHGIPDGTELVTGTYYRLVGRRAPRYEPTEAFFDRLEEAFIWAYLATADEPGIPVHVEAAIDDARVLTYAEFRDDPDADLRTDVIPAFYRRVAAFHCAYRG